MGKSALCNKMHGVKYRLVTEYDEELDTECTTVQIDDDCKVKPIFKSEAGHESVTQNTQWKEINYLGNEKEKLIVIDTPGLNDANVQKAKKHKQDLRKKLESMREVDLVLILLGKKCLGAGGGRLTTSINNMIDEIIHIFGGNENLCDHFAVAFSCCDDCDKGWSQNLKTNTKAWQKTFQEKFFSLENEDGNCNEQKDAYETAKGDKNKIPMFLLSSVQTDVTARVKVGLGRSILKRYINCV